MSGYWRNPEATAAAFTADGYFRTGDIGAFDAAGYLKIVDRKKDMILVSGFNVYPNEVEAVAATCAGIAECVCVGAPDEKTGEAVRLFLVKAPGASVSQANVIAHCRQQLAAYKVPKQVRFLEALPKSAVPASTQNARSGNSARKAFSAAVLSPLPSIASRSAT